jgi:hypothetical protein
MDFTVPNEFLLDCIDKTTKSLQKNKFLSSNPIHDIGANNCYEYIFDKSYLSIIYDKRKGIDILRCNIASIDLYGSGHNICIVKIDNHPIELKINCYESDDDLEFTIFREPDGFKLYREFYQKLIDMFISSENKQTLRIPQI